MGFANVVDQEYLTRNRHLINGSGVAAGDVDGDGWTDLFFTSMLGESSLYRNRGSWKFENVTIEAGLQDLSKFGTGAVLVDIEGDGDLDLLVGSLVYGVRGYLNDGTGRYTDATKELGLDWEGAVTSLALGDIDGDGDLDLYVALYKEATLKDLLPPAQRTFERMVTLTDSGYVINPEFSDHYSLQQQGNRIMRIETGEPDRFYLNNGEDGFELSSSVDSVFFKMNGELDVGERREWGLTARFQDFNGDGLPDLYICNDFESPDRMWLGDGNGRLTEIPSFSVRKTSQSTMSIAAGDINGDGNTDLFLADMLSFDHARSQRQYQVVPPQRIGVGEIDTRVQMAHNTLLIGRGDGTFAEVARAAGVEASEWTWSSTFLDVDLDGDEDLIATTGHAYDAMDADMQLAASRDRDWRRSLLRFPKLELQNVAFKNDGDGFFERVKEGWGLGPEADVSHGMALGDFDNDGDLDVVTNRLNAPAGLYRNNASEPRLAVRLRGLPPNTYGIGARIRVHTAQQEFQEKEMLAGGMYLSSNAPIITFAALQQVVRIEVLWRGGLVSVLDSAMAGHIYEIDEAYAAVAVQQGRTTVNGLFDLQYTGAIHNETAYADFLPQPLLPWRLSQRGPALVVADVDEDGDDDLLQSSGRGGRVIHVVNDDGNFQRTRFLGAEAEDDQAGMVFIGSSRKLLVATGNDESHETRAHSEILEYDARSGTVDTVFSTGEGTISALVVGHFDDDGALDLFVGKHFEPGRYPVTLPSVVFKGGNGGYVVMDSVDALGPVSGAVAGDIDQDGDQDLILAVQWGAIRIFLNTGNGVFEDYTAEFGLLDFTGIWNGVALGDFDSDGRMDFVATNWGWNSSYGPPQSREQPIRMYHGDVDSNDTWDIIETRYDSNIGDYTPMRDLRTLMDAIPLLAHRVRSHNEFSGLTARDLFGPQFEMLEAREARVLASMVFLNRGQSFEAITLPKEAQFAPAFGVSVADLDGDGSEDLFLAQNFFALPTTASRQDAGRGLWLRGNGAGAFEAVPAPVSGLRTYGEQRATAVGDFDSDGKVDLAVTQNGNELHIYRNVGAIPGLRVGLPVPSGVGATIRVRYTDGSYGPARSFSIGSGYWSQDSSELVMSTPRTPQSIWVRWPTGEEQEVPIPPGAGAITLE